MEKEFAPYELALKLKVLGFDEPCFGYYVDGELRGINLGIEELGGVEPYYQRFGFHTLSNHNIDNQNKIVVTAPTFSQAFRWFREKYDLHHVIHQFTFKKGTDEEYLAEVGKADDTFSECRTYEDAEVTCLEKLIEIIEEKQK
jgi:hypothetical protein